MIVARRIVGKEQEGENAIEGSAEIDTGSIFVGLNSNFPRPEVAKARTWCRFFSYHHRREPVHIFESKTTSRDRRKKQNNVLPHARQGVVSDPVLRSCDFK